VLQPAVRRHVLERRDVEHGSGRREKREVPEADVLLAEVVTELNVITRSRIHRRAVAVGVDERLGILHIAGFERERLAPLKGAVRIKREFGAIEQPGGRILSEKLLNGPERERRIDDPAERGAALGGRSIGPHIRNILGKPGEFREFDDSDTLAAVVEVADRHSGIGRKRDLIVRPVAGKLRRSRDQQIAAGLQGDFAVQRTAAVDADLHVLEPEMDHLRLRRFDRERDQHRK